MGIIKMGGMCGNAGDASGFKKGFEDAGKRDCGFFMTKEEAHKLAKTIAESCFSKYDHNKDGQLDKDEAKKIVDDMSHAFVDLTVSKMTYEKLKVAGGREAVKAQMQAGKLGSKAIFDDMDYTRSGTLNLAELEKGIFMALEISINRPAPIVSKSAAVAVEKKTDTAPVPEVPVEEKK